VLTILPFGLAEEWVQALILQEPDIDLSKLKNEFNARWEGTQGIAPDGTAVRRGVRTQQALKLKFAEFRCEVAEGHFVLAEVEEAWQLVSNPFRPC
jgi:hypothetical protein